MNTHSLARTLRTLDYFTLAFGTMVGVGWLITMDDWLSRGGPLGAMLGFGIGGAFLLPIGYVYGRLVTMIPDAASEIAYTARVFSPGVSFATGWMMVLSYLIVCPWEAVAVGKITAYIFPALNSWELYRVGATPVYLPHLVLGLALTALIVGINYRGIRLSATFQNWTTFGLLALTVVVASFGFAEGSPRNLSPLFSHGAFLSILLVVQIVPYFMTGFESVPKCAEEAHPDFRLRGFTVAIYLALFIGILFYILYIAVVAFIHPWQRLLTERFATAVAFSQAVKQQWIVNAILAAALLSLLKVFNGNFIATTRLVLALGRRGLLHQQLGGLHPAHRTPHMAIVWVGLVTAATVFLGESILIPVTEVGSLAVAAGYLATCAAYYWMRPGRRQQAVAACGAVVALLLVLMKILPFVPGHFDVYEWLALGLWCGAGLLLWRRARPDTPASTVELGSHLN